MAILKRLYYRIDEWAKGLSQTEYAVLLGVSGGVGWLVAGLAFSHELRIASALTFGLVMFGVESVFGLRQTGEE